jgi:hypothetical protein
VNARGVRVFVSVRRSHTRESSATHAKTTRVALARPLESKFSAADAPHKVAVCGASSLADCAVTIHLRACGDDARPEKARDEKRAETVSGFRPAPLEPIGFDARLK